MTTNYSNYNPVAIQNIDDEDFSFEYDKSSGNPPYTIPTGAIRRFPKFIAAHAVKHLIDKILTKRQEKTNNQILRESLMSQIIVEEEEFSREPEISEAEKTRLEIERLNSEEALEKVLKRNRERTKDKEPVEPVVTTPEKSTEKFEGLEPGEQPLKGDEEDTTDEKVTPPAKKEVQPIPTRAEIYRYGEKQGMKLDKETKKSLEKMTVEQLLEEVGDPREALV